LSISLILALVYRSLDRVVESGAGVPAKLLVTEGHPAKYCALVQYWPIRLDPIGLPFTQTSEPLACEGKNTWATAHEIQGDDTPEREYIFDDEYASHTLAAFLYRDILRISLVSIGQRLGKLISKG
jgi:hypothetical protein